MAVSGVVCGPGGASGVTYALVGGQQVGCGSDSGGNALYVQVSTLSPDEPVEGGEQVGLDIGAAMLLVMATAWGIRVLRNQLDSGSED
jgi:hypothetical protein